jgi:hypothetical protein
MTQTPAINRSWTGEVCNGNKTGWVGVDCTLGKVTGLNLTTNVYDAQLPSQLYLLSSLVRFECTRCSLNGKDPMSWMSTMFLFLDSFGKFLLVLLNARTCSVAEEVPGIQLQSNTYRSHT